MMITKNKEYLLLFTFGLCLRSMVSIWPYSGQGLSPIYGDYEAQRHWQEITTRLPVTSWYFNGTHNDLDYWGLDYPPLTAYHSWILGKIAEIFLNKPQWTALKDSRGFESPEHKFFMRSTVLFSDLFFYLIGSYLLSKSLDPSSIFFFLSLFPGLILIDNGHFQYNNVSLGFFLLSLNYIFHFKNYKASVFFVLALNYKQMTLYYSLPIFFYLLGFHLFKRDSFTSKMINIVKLGLVVIFTFALIWSPFLFDKTQLYQVLHRIFPVKRGLFEDKVANFWCTLDIVLKVKKTYSQDSLVLCSGGLTLLSSLPSNLILFFQPNFKNLILSLICTSFSFFLFSFHVHEKTILLVAIPVALFCGISQFQNGNSRFVGIYFLLISSFSMIPLLNREGLFIPSVSLNLIFLILCSLYGVLDFKLNTTWSGLLYCFVICVSFSLYVCGLFAIAIIPPPPRYPDLWPVLISVFSFAHFAIFYLYFNYVQMKNCYKSKNTPKLKVN